MDFGRMEMRILSSMWGCRSHGGENHTRSALIVISPKGRRRRSRICCSRRLLNRRQNGVVITDIKGNIAWVNKAFTGMTGYAELDVRGQNLRMLKSGIQDDSFYRSLWDTISAGNVWRGELINMKKDGSLYSEEMTITPLKKANGEITPLHCDQTGYYRAQEREPGTQAHGTNSRIRTRLYHHYRS
jgi:PAS domain S-box-containing protein